MIGYGICRGGMRILDQKQPDMRLLDQQQTIMRPGLINGSMDTVKMPGGCKEILLDTLPFLM